MKKVKLVVKGKHFTYENMFDSQSQAMVKVLELRNNGMGGAYQIININIDLAC